MPISGDFYSQIEALKSFSLPIPVESVGFPSISNRSRSKTISRTFCFCNVCEWMFFKYRIGINWSLIVAGHVHICILSPSVDGGIFGVCDIAYPFRCVFVCVMWRMDNYYDCCRLWPSLFEFIQFVLFIFYFISGLKLDAKTKRRSFEYGHFTLNINHRKIKLDCAIWGLNLAMSPALCLPVLLQLSRSTSPQPIHRSILPPFQQERSVVYKQQGNSNARKI